MQGRKSNRTWRKVKKLNCIYNDNNFSSKEKSGRISLVGKTKIAKLDCHN